jgi:hypothetical protein
MIFFKGTVEGGTTDIEAERTAKQQIELISEHQNMNFTMWVSTKSFPQLHVG